MALPASQGEVESMTELGSVQGNTSFRDTAYLSQEISPTMYKRYYGDLGAMEEIKESLVEDRS